MQASPGLASESGGERPIHIAARRDRPEYIEFLLDRGAWIDAPDARGQTPLDKAVFYGGDGDEAVKVLLRRGAGLDGLHGQAVAVRATELNAVKAPKIGSTTGEADG